MLLSEMPVKETEHTARAPFLYLFVKLHKVWKKLSKLAIEGGGLYFLYVNYSLSSKYFTDVKITVTVRQQKSFLKRTQLAQALSTSAGIPAPHLSIFQLPTPSQTERRTAGAKLKQWSSTCGP